MARTMSGLREVDAGWFLAACPNLDLYISYQSLLSYWIFSISVSIFLRGASLYGYVALHRLENGMVLNLSLMFALEYYNSVPSGGWICVLCDAHKNFVIAI